MSYIQNVRIALEICRWRSTIRSENPVYLVDVCILNNCVLQRLISERQAVIRLIILPPADVPYESVIVERDSLTACADNGIFNSAIENQRLVNVSAFGVGHDRPVCIAIASTVVEIVADRPHIIQFDQESKVGEVRASICQSCSQSRCVCLLGETTLIDEFLPVSEVQVQLAVAVQRQYGLLIVGSVCWRRQ